jgi:hypothetical protein
MFVGKARNIALNWGPVRGSTLVGFSLARKFYARVGKLMELANTLVYYEKATITEIKCFFVQALVRRFFKHFLLI